jgi:molybdopterin/thiamine biosynthesis adenylyltransferase
MNEPSTLFSRISQLFDVGLIGEARVLVAGCGSGGSQVALQLAMSGIRNFELFDSDILEIENVIRHACGRRYVGLPKVDALEDVLLDRNPAIQINKHNVDLMKCADLAEHVKKASVVVLATDNEHTRFKLNEVCVETKTPFVVGRVFTRGIGGEVYSYRPGKTGCLACLESKLERTKFRDGVREIDLVSEEEREKMYGMEVAEIKDSPGLNIDISFITSFHTRFALDAIARSLPKPPKYLIPIEHNYIIWGNRPVHPFTKPFELQRMHLHPQDSCLVCGTGGEKP